MCIRWNLKQPHEDEWNCQTHPTIILSAYTYAHIWNAISSTPNIYGSVKNFIQTQQACKGYDELIITTFYSVQSYGM